MATRIQVRRGSSSDWSTANPTLAAGEIAYNTTLDQIKIGDGSTVFNSLEYFPTLSDAQTFTNKTLTSPLISGLTITDGTVIVEGTTANDFETTLTFTDPTADRTITFPDATGTVALTTGTTFSGAVSGTDLTLSGNLTVNGTTTNINTTNLVVEDKNIILGDVETPSDVTADGGGITLKGATDKTFNWVDSTDSWTSSENIALAATKTIIFEGTTDDQYETTLTVEDPTADRTITFQNATGTVVLRDSTDTLTNKTLTSPVITGLTLNDSSIVFEGATADNFETTLTVTDPTADRTITLPDLGGTVLLSGNFTNKGYLLIGTGSGTFTSVAPGTGGQSLIIDSNEASGMRWATSSSGGAAFSEFMLAGA
jgi:hypothetical protein